VTRRFLPRGLDLADWARVRPLFEDLLARPLDSDAAFRRWLADWSALDDALTEEGGRRRIRTRQDRRDARADKAHMAFVSGTGAKCQEYEFRLQKRLLASPRVRRLGPEWRPFLDGVRAEVRAFRPENVALGVQETRLVGAYEAVIGRMQVRVRGKSMTMARAGVLLTGPDAALREAAWRAIEARRLKAAARIDGLMDRLVRLRSRMAANAGLGAAGYARLNALSRRKLDYGPKDSERFAAAVERLFVPEMRRVQDARRRALGTATLKPWDLAAPLPGAKTLRPYAREAELAGGVSRIFKRLDKTLSGHYEGIRRGKGLDLASRPGKGPGGFHMYLPVTRNSFIFMNGAGLHRDLITLLHESGHAFHSLSNKAHQPCFTRMPGIEFREVASMSMELLGSRYLDEFYSPADARVARRQHLEKVVGLFPWVCAIDRFQHWLYAHPRHTARRRAAEWERLMRRFGGIEDLSPLPRRARGRGWQRQQHPFSFPFYYLEYGIAQTGALQVWRNSRRSFARALRDYRRALSLGGRRDLAGLFRAAGGRFGMDEKTLRPLLAELKSELRALA
jgi:oligoendopeptidase F